METVRGRTGKSSRDTQPRRGMGGQTSAAVLLELKRLGVRLSEPRGMQAVAVVATDGRLVAGNRPLFEMLGCDGNDLLGTPWTDTMPTWEIGQDMSAPLRFEACLCPPLCRKRKMTVPANVCVCPVKDGDRVVAHTVLLTPSTRRVL